MAYSPTVFAKWRYVSDRNINYVYKILQHIVTQNTTAGGTPAKVGGMAATGIELRPSPSFKPRVALLWNAANKLSRRVVCFSQDSALYCGTAPEGENTLQLYAGRPSELLTFVCYGYEGERERGERPTA